MKEKMKPMAIYGGIGAASGAAIAYFMKKKDMKNMLIFAGAGVGLGYSVLGQLWTEDMGIQRFSISAGFGMGLLGLLGFILAGVGLGNGWLMLLILISILAWLVWKGYVLSVFQIRSVLHFYP
jgi:hypothetical protein